MTWEQFKKEVEEQGVKNDTELGYIDVNGGYHPQVELFISKETGKQFTFISSGGFEGVNNADKDI